MTKSKKKPDPHMPPAWGAHPLFRMRLINSTASQLGYELLDVIAVYPREVANHGGATWLNEAWSVLALGSDGKWTPSLVTSDMLSDVDENYEVVT